MQLPRTGDVLGDQYKLGRQLGEGSFALVFRARDLMVEREVAIKLLKPRDGGYSHALRRRFVREIRAMGALQDPHTIQVFSNGETDEGVLWFACELLGGMDLSEWIERRGELDEAAAVHILRQLLGSLREAHAAGLIHRDIKPANIRVFTHLDDPYYVKLMDFGVAKPTGPDITRLTRTGGVVGTVRFMPPEQLAGEATFASDIYALGVVMLDMLFGERVEVSVVTGPRPIDVPASRQIADVVNRLLAPDLDQRPPSADAVLYLLDSPAPVVARPSPPSASTPSSSAPTVARRPRRSGRRQVLAAFAVAFAVVCVGLVAVLQPSPDPRPPMSAVVRANPLAAPEVSPATTVDSGASGDVTNVNDSGCGREVPRGDTMGHVAVGVRPVEWHLYVPEAYDESTPAPVVFFFYDGVTPTDAGMEHTNIRRLADEMNAILVAPLRDTSRPNWDAHTTLDFATVLDEVGTTHCVDRARVFALGHETGGHAAIAMSCEPWIRAVATTAYRQSSVEPPCEPWKPKPLIMFAPRDYPGLPIDGGTDCGITVHLSLAEHEKIWWERNVCESKSKKRRLEHGACQTWKCQAPTVSCVVDGGLGWRGSPRRNFDLLGCDGAPTKFDYIPRIVEEFATFQ